ncbi:MAG: hypothetical protein ABFD92_16630 [Planctomycetaceae bacterium]|nr:hypothetical protein [Planctomycetaceae bacterium]
MTTETKSRDVYLDPKAYADVFEQWLVMTYPAVSGPSTLEDAAAWLEAEWNAGDYRKEPLAGGFAIETRRDDSSGGIGRADVITALRGRIAYFLPVPTDWLAVTDAGADLLSIDNVPVPLAEALLDIQAVEYGLRADLMEHLGLADNDPAAEGFYPHLSVASVRPVGDGTLTCVGIESRLEEGRQTFSPIKHADGAGRGNRRWALDTPAGHGLVAHAASRSGGTTREGA